MDSTGTSSNPWLIFRELPQLSYPNEKMLVAKGNSTLYNNFNKSINDNNLIDLGFSNNPYIWHNKEKAMPLCDA